MLFSIDHGNSAVKTPNFTFTSGLADYPVRPPVETDVLEYAGKFWTLSGQRISYMRDKTQNDRYFILTLFAIAKELQRMGTLPTVVEAELAVGLPPEHYALRRKFASYFQRGSVQFTFNSTPVCLSGHPGCAGLSPSIRSGGSPGNAAERVSPHFCY